MKTKKLNIFIGTYEVASILSNLSNGLSTLGHKVTTFNKYSNPFYETKYTYDFKGIERFERSLNKNLKVILKHPLRVIKYIITNIIFYRSIHDHDVYIFIWSSFFPSHRDLKLLHKKNKKIIVMFMGSDVRDLNAFEQEFKTVENWDPKYFSDVNKKIEWVRMAELYSDIIFSVPDQSGLLIAPYYHCHIPISLKSIKFSHSKNKIPHLIHAPSNAQNKGTNQIESTIDQLRNEGLIFEYKTVSGIPNSELLNMLTEHDILIDAINMNGPGVLGLEGMAAGCAVATKCLKSRAFSPPVCEIDESNLYEKIKKLITDVNYRDSLIIAGKSYVDKNNSSTNVAQHILNKLTIPNEPDYTSDFFLSKFNPPSSYHINRKNKQLTLSSARKYHPSADLSRARSVNLL